MSSLALFKRVHAYLTFVESDRRYRSRLKTRDARSYTNRLKLTELQEKLANYPKVTSALAGFISNMLTCEVLQDVSLSISKFRYIAPT